MFIQGAPVANTNATITNPYSLYVGSGNSNFIANVLVGNVIGPHANGNSNINIPAANGNVNISAIGTANVLVVTATGANIAGTISASGNANVGNLGTVALVATSAVTFTATTGEVLKIGSSVAGTTPIYLDMFNTSGGLYLGLEGSAGNALWTNIPAYATGLGARATGGGISFSANSSTQHMLLTTAGLAITGTLGVTGVITRTATAASNSSGLILTGSTTGNHFVQVNNTGGTLYSGVDSSVGGSFTGVAAYGSFVGTAAGTTMNLGSNAIATLISNAAGTGITIPGTLGVTGTSTLRTTSLRDTTPEANNTYTLGTNAFRWGDFRTQVGQCYGLLDVGTADINIGFQKAISVLATSASGAIVAKTVDVGYPILAGWNAADAGDNIFTYWYVNTAGDNKGSIAYNRTANLIAYNTTSDATLKNLIGDAPQARSLEILSQTRLREYSWKEDKTNRPQIGVIAQELYEVFPGAVSVGGDLAGTDEDGNPTTKYHPWSVDKTAYQFHLVAGWQNHESRIAELEAKNIALEARLAALEAK
jgi:hypothetical protein